MKQRILTLLFIIAGTVIFAGQADVALEQKEDKFVVTFGGDLRLRYDLEHAMPTTTHGQGVGHEDHFRVRTRLWGQAEMGPFTFYTRLADEFRYYNSPSTNKGKMRFPDVVFFDNLYLAYKGEWIQTIVGRQDISFGEKRVIGDATGGDGGRSAYADAFRLTFDFGSKRTLDAFALYQAREDWLPTWGETHSSQSAKGSDYDITGYRQNELGAGLYYQDRSNADLGWDAYAIYKVEENDSTISSKQSKVIPKGKDSFSTQTFGARLLPKFTETLSGEVELALQPGTDSHLGTMGYAGLTFAPKYSLKPKFVVGILYLSGDKEGARGKHAWQSVFNHNADKMGDAPAKMYSRNSYTNLLYPSIAFSFVPAEHQSIKLETGPMFAPAIENDGTDDAYGNFRGYYGCAKYSCAFGQFFDNEWLNGFGFTASGEFLTKGDYFKDDQDDVALFGRFELTYKF